MYSSSILSGKMATPLVLKSSTAFEKSTDWFLVAVEHRPLAPRARLVCAAPLHITIILAHFTRFNPTLKGPVQKLSKCPNTGPGWQKEGAEQLVNKADLRIGMGRHSSHLTWQQVWSVHSFQIRQWTRFLIFFPFTSGVFDDICSPLLCLKGTSGVSL